MGCGCANKKKKKARTGQGIYDVMGGYKYLKANQINERLKVFKRIYCKPIACDNLYTCDFTMYTECKKVKKGE